VRFEELSAHMRCHSVGRQRWRESQHHAVKPVAMHAAPRARRGHVVPCAGA
jgi:hypothetical protein